MKKLLFVLTIVFSFSQIINAQQYLFYNKGNGATTAVFNCELAGGNTHTSSSGWTHIVHRQNFYKGGGSYFFYNAESGLGLTTKDEYENFATVSTTQMTQGWTHVVQIDASNKLLFYNSNSGLAVITNGDLVTVLNRTIAAGWTHIISLGTNILFYDANTGAGTVTNASFQTVSTHAMSGGWTHIVRLQRGVLFYNSNTGLAVLTNTRTLGNIQTYTFAAGWTHILPPESCNQVFFYNATTAAGTVTDANFRTLSTHAMSGGWTTILGIAILL